MINGAHLCISIIKAVQALLNDVVPIQVLNKLDYLMLKRFDNGLNLLRRADEFDHFLKRSCPVAVEGYFDHFGRSVIDQHRSLFIIRKLQELLA